MASNRPQLHGSFEYFSTGDIKEDSFDVSSEYALSILTEDVGAGNLIVVEAKLLDQANWNVLGTISGENKIDVNVSTYDMVRFRCTVYDPILVPRLIFSAFFTTPVEGSQLKLTAPVGDTDFEVSIQDSVNYTSSDSSVTITGDATTGSLDFKVSATAGTSRLVEDRTITALEASNGYIILTDAPITKEDTVLDIVGGSVQFYAEDFIVTNDDAGKRLSWSGLNLDGVLAAGDKLIISYK